MYSSTPTEEAHLTTIQTKKATNDESCYVYQHLGGGEIRLLELLPGPQEFDPNCRVHCTIAIATLQRKHHTIAAAFRCTYDALSYTWGSKSSPRYILLNGCRHQVTENLEGALWELSRLAEPRSTAWQHSTTQIRQLWVDSLCINQENLEELNNKLMRMNIIYVFLCHCSRQSLHYSRLVETSPIRS